MNLKSVTHVVFLGGPGITYEELAPPPELAPWVAVFWRMRASIDTELRILPDGCMDVIGDDVIGSFAEPGFAHFAPGDSAQGVRFHPGGFPALTGVPADELTGARVPLADVLGRGRSLRRLARDAPAPDPLARATHASRDLKQLARDSGYRRHPRARGRHSPRAARMTVFS